ncbi:MAG: EAL domain-containing protein [Thermoanaerobaculia bacterium]
MTAGILPVRKVLILDDEERVLRTLVRYLRAPHLHIVTCSEIEAAECLLDRYHFDVLVTDLEVSHLGGLEGIRLIRHASVHFPDLDVIVFSGKLNRQVREIGTALGVKGLLEKPTGLSDLRELIDRGSPVPVLRSADGSSGEVSRVAKLDDVLTERSISAVLQPIVGLNGSSQISSDFGVEGLARGPADSVLRNPELLLGYASKKERLFETELLCIEAVLTEARHLSGVGKLFINVRPDSVSNPRFATALGDLVHRKGFQRTEIVLELTEQQSILNLEAFDSSLETLHDLGFGLALDDFGSGFANLHLLQQLPLDYLKVDGFFCRNIEHDGRKQSILYSTFQMARDLGIATITERVETASELEMIKSLGASYAQGYYFSRPIPGRELARSFAPQAPGELREDPARFRPAGSAPQGGKRDYLKHEISNLLTAIALYAAQSLKRVDEDDPLHDDLKQIQAASEQAISLAEN